MQSNLPQMTAGDAADFFSQLGQKDQTAAPTGQQEERKVEREPESDSVQRQSSRQVMAQETVSRNINWDEGSEGIIKQNLLIGELEYAA